MRRSPLFISAAFHAVIFFLAVSGLPFLGGREFVVPKPIVVDFIEIAKVTETNRITPQPVAPEKPEPKEEKPPPAPQNTAQEVVAPVKEKPEPEVKKEVKKAPKAEVLDENAPEKAKKVKKEETKKEPAKDFSSVLKNLADPKQTAKDAPDLKLDETSGPPEPGQTAPLGERMTMSEEDALRGQLEKCWNVPIGAKDAENIAVDIFMVINPDRTLREARVVNTLRYNSDNIYRAVADSALRAVRSTSCSPFDLPPDKYKTWNTTTVTFNPKDMF